MNDGDGHMNGAVFFLVVNFLIGTLFSTLFYLVSTRTHSRTAVLWMAAGFTVGSLAAVCELLVSFVGPPKLWALAAFATFLTGAVLFGRGINAFYGRQLSLRLTTAYVIASLCLAYLIYDLPRGTPTQAFLYQAPFAIPVLASAWVVLSGKRKLPIDRFLGFLLLMTGLHFFGKAWLAVMIGSGSTAVDYLRTNYALVSQSSSAVLMVALGLTLLTILILDIMAEQRAEADRDPLSGLLNRRGFHRLVEQRLIAAGEETGHVMIVCDLDHFKQINDSHGHAIGDLVIQIFARTLVSASPEGAVIGRLGGEEFAVFLPETDVDDGVRRARIIHGDTIRLRDLPASVTVTASFGVSQFSSKDGAAKALNHADEALYNAKHSGRNRVEVA